MSPVSSTCSHARTIDILAKIVCWFRWGSDMVANRQRILLLLQYWSSFAALGEDRLFVQTVIVPDLVEVLFKLTWRSSLSQWRNIDSHGERKFSLYLMAWREKFTIFHRVTIDADMIYWVLDLLIVLLHVAATITASTEKRSIFLVSLGALLLLWIVRYLAMVLQKAAAAAVLLLQIILSVRPRSFDRRKLGQLVAWRRFSDQLWRRASHLEIIFSRQICLLFGDKLQECWRVALRDGQVWLTACAWVSTGRASSSNFHIFHSVQFHLQICSY